jgi:hypothetical protein
MLVAHACNPSHSGGRNQLLQGQCRQNEARIYLKNSQHKKRAGRVAQVVERLPGKYEAMS